VAFVVETGVDRDPMVDRIHDSLCCSLAASLARHYVVVCCCFLADPARHSSLEIDDQYVGSGLSGCICMSCGGLNAFGCLHAL
jgi:hypothetical protein